jgi:hypothetical protein
MDIAVPAPKPTQPKGPGEVSHGKPKPTHPKPNHPQGPGDISPAPKPGHPDGPGDITSPEPEPTHPDGPGDLSAPKPCPTHGVDCTPDNGDKGDQPQGNGGNGGGSTDASHTEDATFATPTRVDAGTASAADQHGENGLELSFLLAGGALVTVTGAAFAARKRARA